jgi:hypothetical protein
LFLGTDLTWMSFIAIYPLLQLWTWKNINRRQLEFGFPDGWKE